MVAAVPATGVFRAKGAVVSLADGPLSRPGTSILNGQVVAMRGLDENEYPTSNMGAVAATRQAFMDALWWRDAEAAYAASPAGRARPRFTAATAALVPAAEGRETVVFETTDVLSLLRAARIARELCSSPGSWRRVMSTVCSRRSSRRSPTSSCASHFRSRTSWIGTRSGSTSRRRACARSIARPAIRGGFATPASTSR